MPAIKIAGERSIRVKMVGTNTVDAKQTTSSILQPGTPAPDFSLKSTPDQSVSLSEFRGMPVILVFYPEDWSPVCSDELSLFTEVLPEFERFNAQLFGISVDSAWSHLAFSEQRNL